MMKPVLYYVHDPMCSWCWAFSKVYAELYNCFAARLTLVELLGGLAPDSDQAMPEEMQRYIQQTWRKIEQSVVGVRFNFDFWQQCRPIRSTYPACRAVIAARQQGKSYSSKMVKAIQKAYYTEARNPSEQQVLVELASQLGLDVEQFTIDIDALATHQQLQMEIKQCRALQIDSFPSLLFDSQGSQWHIPVDYNSSQPMIEMLNALLGKDGE